MSKVIDMDTWREAQIDRARDEMLNTIEEYWDEFEREHPHGHSYTHVIVAEDRTDPAFIELREELDKENRDYRVMSKSPREFDV